MQAGKVFLKEKKDFRSRFTRYVRAVKKSLKERKRFLSSITLSVQAVRKASFKEEKGSILFLVVLFAAALLLLGTAFLRSSLQEKLIAGNYTQKIKAHYIAEAGMETALTLLGNQPDYFLYHNFDSPVYIHSDYSQEGDCFKLEWLKTDNYLDCEECYILKAHGYTHSTFKNRGARAEIKALVKIDWAENENDAGDNNSVEDESGAGKENNAVKTSIILLHLSGQ